MDYFENEENSFLATSKRYTLYIIVLIGFAVRINNRSKKKGVSSTHKEITNESISIIIILSYLIYSENFREKLILVFYIFLTLGKKKIISIYYLILI